MILPDRIDVQGRTLLGTELLELQNLIATHPQWSRKKLARTLCLQWGWQTPTGQLKTFAARSLLLKLEQRQGLKLPPLRTQHQTTPWGVGGSSAKAPGPSEPIECGLGALQPLQWHLLPRRGPRRECALAYLREYHYLGCNRPVGSHLLYLVEDAHQRDLAVHLVGAAAWQCAPRDRYIGWSTAQRRVGLPRVANHSRFLIFPWVKTPQLASHLLGELTRRLAGDWRAQHGWELELVESFVETVRFAGTAYQAANWQQVGWTTGRTRQEKQHRPQAPVKTVWVYPLHRQFRQRLNSCGQKGAL